MKIVTGGVLGAILVMAGSANAQTTVRLGEAKPAAVSPANPNGQAVTQQTGIISGLAHLIFCFGGRGYYGGWGCYGCYGGWGCYGGCYGGWGGYGYGYPTGYGYGYGGYGYGGYGGYGYPYYGGYGYSYPYYTAGYASPGVGVTYSSAYVAPGASAANTVMPAQGRYLGIDEDPVTDSSGRKGMKVSNVYPGTPAQRAGLQVGDVIYSINGYLTEQRGNLAWIIANAAPNNQLNITLKRASDGQQRSVTAQIQ